MKLLATVILSVFVGYTANTQHPTSKAPHPDHKAEKKRQLADFLTSQAHLGFSGVALVNVDGKTILHEAYDPAGQSMDKNSCFWIASVSKMFAAATAVLLHQKGDLDLHAPITTYLDEVPVDKQGITMHHLLTHTSGLGSYIAEGIVERAEAAQSILNEPLKKPIGTSYLYSGDGYNLAAIIIEVVTGQPFESVVEKEILRPLKMTRTGFWGFPLNSSGCKMVPFQTEEGISETLLLPNYGFRGSTGMRSSAEDLLLWYQGLFNNAVVPAQVRELILTPHVQKASSVNYGYGWNIVETPRGTRMLAHTGQDDMITHVSYLYAFPDEGVVLILLTNSSTEIGNETLIGMRRILFAG